MIDRPVYCLTTDTDWASEFAIEQFFELLSPFAIRPTVFATHQSAAVDRLLASGAGEVGIHPNFFPGSTQGATVGEVLDHLQRLYPQAEAVRSHAAFEHSRLAAEFYRRGFRFASNVLLFMQPGLVPLRGGLGLTQFPVFWEEDVHWHNLGADWDLDRLWPAFLTPGLKVLNVHPFMIAINACDQEHYERSKHCIPGLTAQNVAEVRNDGAGAQTFLLELLRRLAERGARFSTLGALYREFPIERFMAPGQEWLARPQFPAEKPLR